MEPLVHFCRTDVSELLAVAVSKANSGNLQGAHDDCVNILNVAPDELDARMLRAMILEHSDPVGAVS